MLAFLRMAIVAAVAGSLAALTMMLIFAPHETQRMYGPLGISVVALAARVLLRRGNPKAGVMVLAWGIWVVATGISVANGGVRTPVVFVYPLLIIFSGWLLGPRSAIAIAICCAATGLAFATAEFLQVLPAQPVASPYLHWVIQTTIFAVSVSAILYLLRSHQQNIEEVRTLTADLARENANAAAAASLRSSQELLDRTGRLARVGGWEIEVANGQLTWTAETFRILDLEAGTPPTIMQSIAYCVPEMRTTVEFTIKNAIDHGIGFDLELQLDTAHGRRIWVRFMGTPRIENDRVVYVTGALQDITEQHQAAQALKTSLNSLQRTLEATNEGIFGYDRDDPSGKLLFANNRVFEMWNIPLENIPTTGRAELLEASKKFLDEPELESLRIEEIRNKASLYEDKIYLNDGRILFRRSVPLQEGSLSARVWSFRDITAEEKASDELKASRDEAQRASMAKSEFLSRMSHELRTPMHAIMGMVTLAGKRMDDPKGLDHLGKAKAAADHLLNLINDILDISKIEAGRLVLEQIDFALKDVLENIVNLTGQKAAEKGLPLQIDLPANVAELSLRGDSMRLTQILLNLTGNAIKFSQQGSIEVRAEKIEESATEVLLRFEVRDSGIGVSADEQKRLFVTFEQADGSMTRKYGGSGLGLSISKQLVQLMGGEIGVDSVAGQGSTFWFTARLGKHAGAALPRAPARAQEATKAELRRNHAGARILLADDDPISQEISRALLRDTDLEVDLADDGAMALAMARANSYQLIFLDMQMPIMNGVEAAREIRRQSLNTTTPILALTANAFEEDRKLCLEAGMNDHIGKPVDPKLLFETTLKWLTRTSETEAVA